jgi:hypothetical protein
MISARILTSCALVLVTTHSILALNVRTEASAAWSENIGRSTADVDWRDAMRYEARTSLSLLREWHAGFMTTGELGAGYEHVPKFSRLEAFHGGIATTVRQKFGFGAFAPALALDLGLRGRNAKLNGDDGWTATAGLRATKRVTEAWRFGVVTDWQQHYAKSSIFDTRHHRVFGTLAWDISSRLQLSHGNGRLWGDFTANASRTVWSRALSGALGNDLAAYYNTVPWAMTDSLGPRWVTYRVTGRVNFWWFELSPALGRNTSLPLRYESLFSVNKAGAKYRQDIWTLQLLHRF